MSSKKNGAILSFLFLVSFLFTCTGCGPAHLPAKGSGKPDSVQIEITDQWVNPAVTITDANVVQQLYTRLYALSELRPQPCSTEAGPAYILTFSQGSKQLTSASIERAGCGTVSIQGESQDRQLTQTFWSFVAQSIKKATATTRINRLAIQPVSDTGLPEQQTGQITSAATAQRLYSTLLALPQQSFDSVCPNGGFKPIYLLIFHATNQLIQAQIGDTGCHYIMLSSISYIDRVYGINETLQKLLTQEVEKSSFFPAKPDSLSVTINDSYRVEVHDPALIQSFYKKVLTLQPSSQGDCSTGSNERDNIFLFSQWGLPLQKFMTRETGNCTEITTILTSTTVNLQGDAGFWTLVHRATGQK